MYFIYYSGAAPAGLMTPAGEARSNWYGVGGLWPAAFFDGAGRAPQVTETDSFYPVFRNMADAARSRSTVIEMSLDSLETRADSAQVRVGVHITPTDSVIDHVNSLRLVAVLFQDSVPYELFGDTFYASHAVRAVIGDTWGIPVHLQFGTTFDTTLVVPTAADWKPRLLGVAAFVQGVSAGADTFDLQVLQATGKFPIGN